MFFLKKSVSWILQPLVLPSVLGALVTVVAIVLTIAAKSFSQLQIIDIDIYALIHTSFFTVIGLSVLLALTIKLDRRCRPRTDMEKAHENEK